MSNEFNPIDQFDDLLSVSNPDEVSVSELIFNLTLEQNARVDEIRRVTEDQLEEVAIRALAASASDGLTTEVRYFNVFRELAHFVTLSTEGPRPNGSDRNTDLLPEYHPSSSAEITLSVSEFREKRGEWYAADPRIEDDEVRSLVASVYSSNPFEVQFQHAYARLSALPAGSVPRDLLLSPITAGLWGKLKGLFKSSVFAGKNSSYWRSLRAKRQLRDSKGRWIEMGGGGTVNVKFPTGKIQSVPGRVAGYSTEQGFIDFEIKGVPGLKDGIYRIPANLFEAVMAILPAEAVKNLPIDKAIADVTDGNFIDISDLVAVESPEGWVKSPYAPTNKALAGKEPSDAKYYVSADGYEVSYIANPSKNEKTKDTNQKFLEMVKDLYGDKLDVVGTDGTENIDWSDPLYILWASKRGKGSTPIAFTQDWARVQKIAGEEDERFGDKENQIIVQDERPVAAKGPSPKEERGFTPEDENVLPYTGDDPDKNLPQGWTKIGPSSYLSKNRRFKVDYGFGEAGLESSLDELTGEIRFTPIYANNVYSLYERDDNGDFTKKFDLPFFTWEMVSEQVKAIEELEALDPLFNPNIAKVPYNHRKMYAQFDPSERFEYDYFGPDSNKITKSDAIIAEFLERFFPGTGKEEKFNSNGVYLNKFRDITATLVQENGIDQIRIADSRGNILDNIPVQKGQDRNKVLTLALQKLFPRPEILSNFSLLDSFKDFDITNGRSAQKTADALEEALYQMYLIQNVDKNKITDELYTVGKLATAVDDFIRNQNRRRVSLGPSPKEENKKYRANDHLEPNEAQVWRLVAILNSHFVQGETDLIAKVRDIKKNPGKYTVREVNDLGVYIEQNFKALSEEDQKKLTWMQKETLEWALKTRIWRRDEAAELTKRLLKNEINKSEFGEILEKINSLPYKPKPAPAMTQKEIDELEQARAEDEARRGKKEKTGDEPFRPGDEWRDLPSEKPKYLVSKLSPENYGPSDGQLAGIERFLEDRQIPESERQEFLDNYEWMDSKEIREWYYTFKAYPFKPEYSPKGKYGLVPNEIDGASDRMIASMERIFDKGLATNAEIAKIQKALPKLNRWEVSKYIMGELKAREDAHDSILIKKAIEDGQDINDIDFVSLIGRATPPEGWEGYEPNDAARAEILADWQDEQEVKQFASRAARRNAARRTRYALNRMIAHLARQRDSVNADGRRILDGAIADANDLKRMIDLRIKYVISPKKVMDRLETIRKGLTDSDKAHTYGRIRNPKSKTMGILEDAASLMGDLIGRDGYHNGPYEYDPNGEYAPNENAVSSNTEFVPSSDPEPETSNDDPDYSDHPNRPQPPKRVKPKAFWGIVRDWVSGAKTWSEAKEAFSGKTLFFFDVETTGVPSPLAPHIKNDPIQIAIYKVKDGVVIDKFVSYMNPDSPLSKWSKANLKDDKGNRISAQWLASLPNKAEVIAKAVEFLGKDAVLAGHNVADFDLEVLNRTLREAGLEEYVPAGMVDTLGLADHIYNEWSKKDPRGPWKTFAFGPTKSTSIEALALYEGIPFKDLHNSENDLDVNVQLLDLIFNRAINGGEKIADDVFDLNASDNDYDEKLAKYKVGFEAFLTRAIDFMAKMAVQRAANGNPVSEQDLIDAATNLAGAKDVEGTPSEPSSTPPPNNDDNDDQPITISNVMEDIQNGIRPPTPKQLKSVERRLLDPRGIIPKQRADEIWDLLPNLNRNEIGDIIKEMDIAQVEFYMANDLDIAGLRIPTELLDKVNEYQDKRFPDRRKRDDKGPSPKEERPADRKNAGELEETQHDISFLEKNYTKQQRNAIEAMIRGWSIVIKALAGTGKSSTLIGGAKAIFHYDKGRRILVLAFNKAIATELRGKFPANAEVRTMDSISVTASANAKLYRKFSAMQKQTESRNRPIYGFSDLADYYKIKDEVELANGIKISKFLFIKIALAGLHNWVVSGDDEMSEKHFSGTIPRKKGGDEGYTPEMLRVAKEMWDDKLEPHDPGRRQIAVNFNDMMKNFALTHPDLTATNSKGESLHGLGAIPQTIMIDEAQDVNGVFYRMIAEQQELHNNGIQLVVVGDPHQSIYQFRGAINSLSKFLRDATLPLTKMFRAGQKVADYANILLDIKDEDDERLVGNPDKDSEVLTPGSMIDATMILTMTNAGALSEIVPAISRGQTIGVTREFKYDMNSFMSTAKWLWFGSDPKKRPSKPHEDLDGYDDWKQMLEIYEETKDVPVGKLLKILDDTKSRLEAEKRPSKMSDVFTEIQKIIDRARIFGIEGFFKPEDDNWGTSGDIGNYISYEIKDGLIRLFTTGRLGPWAPELKNPNNGTRNHSDVLKSLGYNWDTGKTWDFTLPVRGDGKQQLNELVDALSGKDVDVVILTIHRAKGLESERVRLGSDIPKPHSKKDTLSIEKGEMPRPFSTETLNALYVGVTRTMSELDPGAVDTFIENAEEYKQKRKEYLQTLADQKAESDKGPSPKQEKSSDYNYNSGWNTEYLGGPSGDEYKHTWNSPDEIYSAEITNDAITVNRNGSEIFRASNNDDQNPENIKDSAVSMIADVIRSDSAQRPVSRRVETQEIVSPEEADKAYTEAMEAEYNYQMSLEPISRDPRYPGGERGLKELEAAINATERYAAEVEDGLLDPIPNGLDPEEYVAQLKSALPNKRVELVTEDNGDQFVRISEVVNRADIFDISTSIFANKDLEDLGPSPKEEGPKNVKKNKEAVDEVLKGIIEAMDKGIIPWKKPWTDDVAWVWPTSGATGKNYKGINLIKLLFISQERDYQGTRWYTKNAIAKMGGYVDSNDAVDIIKVVKYKSKVNPKPGSTVIDPVTGEEKPDDGTRVRTGLEIDFVYNEDVVKGITIPSMIIKDPPPQHEVEDIILNSYKDKPRIIYWPQEEAYWSPQKDTIRLPLRHQFKSTEEHLDTLFHELIHSTGHPSRLDRKDLLENYGQHKDVRAREELIAEIGSAILASMFGVKTSIENVAAYVQSWKRFLQDDPSVLMEAASLASKGVDHILAGWYEDNPDEEYDPTKKTEVESMPETPITGEDGTSGGLGGGVNYRIEGNRIFLMGDTYSVKDIITALSIIPNGKKIPFSFFWDRKAGNWSISLADPADRVKILEDLKAALNGGGGGPSPKQEGTSKSPQIHEFERRIKKVSEVANRSLSSYEREEIKTARYAELDMRFRYGYLDPEALASRWLAWDVDRGELSDFELEEFELLTKEWDRTLANALMVRKPALELLKQIRQEKARRKRGKPSPANSIPVSSWGKEMTGWPDSPINLTKVGTKDLPTGWKYRPASKAPDILAEKSFGKLPSGKFSYKHHVAHKYYKSLANKNELEFYEHSSGLIVTFEGGLAKLSDNIKNRFLQNAAELHKPNKENVDGDVIIRVNSEVGKNRRREAWAADYRHTGAKPFGNRNSEHMAVSTNKTKMIVIATITKMILVHEYGHLLRFANVTEIIERISRRQITVPYYKKNGAGDSLMGAEKRRPRVHLSEYSKNNADEWYAEAFTFWVDGGGSFDSTGLSDSDKIYMNNFAKDQGWRMPQ